MLEMSAMPPRRQKMSLVAYAIGLSVRSYVASQYGADVQASLPESDLMLCHPSVSIQP